MVYTDFKNTLVIYTAEVESCVYLSAGILYMCASCAPSLGNLMIRHCIKLLIIHL